MLDRAFNTKTTSGELGFRNQKSTRDDLLLTDVGVRFPTSSVTSAQSMSVVCTCFPGVTASVFYCFVVPLDATMPGRCHSNEKWLEKDEYKSWMKKSGKNPKKAFYFACKKRIDLNVMGESTLKRKKLEEYVRLCGNEKAFRISEFFISSVSKTMVQSTGSRVQQLIETSQMAIVASAAAPHKSSVAKYPVSSLLKCNNKGRDFAGHFR